MRQSGKKHFVAQSIGAFVAGVFFLLPPVFGQTASSEPSDDVNYRIGAKDLLGIRVFGVSDLNADVRVSEDGTMTLPTIGEVRAEGLTSTQLAQKLAELLEKNTLKNPQVTVFIREYQSKKVSVIGAVSHPGEFELVGRQTLLQFLSKAGVSTETASDQIVLIRGQESRLIDRNELMWKGDPALNIEMRPGDIINIPVQEFIDIYMFGQFQRPGSVKLKKNSQTTLLKAIALAGGFTTRAKKSSVFVRRQKDGKEVRFSVNVSKIIRGKAPDFLLENDDVVHVGESLL
jgi:polysaccharide biosynthesis/export protein